MQLTSPFFLFIFLPLAMLLLLAMPRRYRAATLAAVSLLYFLLLNRDRLGMTLAALVIFLLSYLACLLPQRKRWLPVTVLFGIFMPVSILFFTHYLTAAFAFPYPYGITFVALGAVSATVDGLRGDLPRSTNPLTFAGALFCFPLMTAGPLLRAKDLAEMQNAAAPSLSSIASGAQLYMRGFIKRLMFAAPFARFFQFLLSLGYNGFDTTLILLILLFALLALGFFLSGTFDMGRGILTCLGMSLPHRVGAAPSLLAITKAWFSAYIEAPIKSLFGQRVGGALAPILTFVAVTTLLRPGVELLLSCLPLFAVWLCYHYVARSRKLPRWVALLIFLPLLAYPAAMLLMKEPAMFLPQSALSPGMRDNVSYLSTSFVEECYRVLFSFALLLPPLLLALFKKLVYWLASARTRSCFWLIELIFTMLYFTFTVLYFLPKFPQLANIPIENIYW